MQKLGHREAKQLAQLFPAKLIHLSEDLNPGSWL